MYRAPIMAIMSLRATIGSVAISTVGTCFIKPIERRRLLDRLEHILIKIDLKEAYKRLTEREKKIITLYYLEGYKDEEIAKLYGINRQNVNRQRKRGISKLKIF